MNALGRMLHAALLAAAVVLSLAGIAGLAEAAELLRDESSGLQYIEIVTGGADPAAQLPVVVAIHGLGDRPESFRLLLDDLPAGARVIVPRAPMPHGADGFSWFEFHTEDDVEGAEQLVEGVRVATERLAVLLVALSKRYGGPTRSVVCGFSQGGMLSFSLAATHPELVAAAIPVAGYLPSSLWPAERPRLRPLPKVLALHGETDRLITIRSARWTIEALRSNGYGIELRSWPGVGHALVPEIRATLVASVVEAVEELSPPGTVLQGPPAPLRVVPAAPDAADAAAPPLPEPPLDDADLQGFPPELPQLDVPSPLQDEPASR